MPKEPTRVIDAVPLLTSCAAVIAPVAAPPNVNDVRLVIGPSVKLPLTVSPVPVGVVPVAKSLSNTCASVFGTLAELSDKLP